MEKKYSEERLLMHDLKDKKEAAWEFYYKLRFKGLKYHASLFFLEHPQRNQLAEDVVGEAILKLNLNIQSLDSLRQVEAFLNTTIRNLCIDHIRHFSTKDKVQTNLKIGSQSFEEQGSDNLTQAEVINAVFEIIESVLDPVSNKIFKLKYLNGLSIEEIATQVGLSIDAVESRRKRGIKKLKSLFKNVNLPILTIILTVFR
jgi:RNA polymerase sigma factor (sigma-70 family)